ncbi:MAG TPA: NTP transferase domain-containing protein [Rhodanobacteraceae bacterium]|nr:NTP transferase domain-containing protein [Rhodanobacteraceae bacterium]
MNPTQHPPALVILAAGLGSRYGASKQTAGIGPDGEWLLEYAIHDALAAGFQQIVLVIRADTRAMLDARLAPKLAGRAKLQFVEQDFDHVPDGCKVPPNRSKPLGTGHALWCCTPLLHGPYAVINADDYYGRHAFALLAGHFHRSGDPAMVGYRLDQTLSAHGAVNRGVCRVDASGHLLDVSEYLGIARDDSGSIIGTAPDGTRQMLADDTVVSLNCWGLTPALLPDLEAGLRGFLATAGERDEYFLPDAITTHLAAHRQPLSVLPSDDDWLGLTYADDRERVVNAIAGWHAAGCYPTPLWPRA